jgi:hypothetical protein
VRVLFHARVAEAYEQGDEQGDEQGGGCFFHGV